MVKLRRDDKGNYLARKRLPDDVREEYGRRYGAYYEAKFSVAKTTKSHEAQQRYGEWLAEVKQSRAKPATSERTAGGTLARALMTTG